MQPTNDDDTLKNSDERTADIIINEKTDNSILLKLYLLKSRKDWTRCRTLGRVKFQHFSL